VPDGAVPTEPMQVGDVKQKIYTHVGTNPGSQELILKSGGEAVSDNGSAWHALEGVLTS
jgi:hypothetical protein